MREGIRIDDLEAIFKDITSKDYKKAPIANKIINNIISLSK